MGRTNIYHGIVILLLVEKENATQEILTHCFGVCMITLPFAQPTIMIQFLIILGSFSHKNPPLNINVPIILILLIFHNITFGPSHPHRIDFRVSKLHKNKIISKQVTKRHVCNSTQERAQYGGMTWFLGSTSTMTGMDACS